MSTKVFYTMPCIHHLTNGCMFGKKCKSFHVPDAEKTSALEEIAAKEIGAPPCHWHMVGTCTAKQCKQLHVRTSVSLAKPAAKAAKAATLVANTAEPAIEVITAPAIEPTAPAPRIDITIEFGAAPSATNAKETAAPAKTKTISIDFTDDLEEEVDYEAEAGKFAQAELARLRPQLAELGELRAKLAEADKLRAEADKLRAELAEANKLRGEPTETNAVQNDPAQPKRKHHSKTRR